MLAVGKNRYFQRLIWIISKIGTSNSGKALFVLRFLRIPDAPEPYMRFEPYLKQPNQGFCCESSPICPSNPQKIQIFQIDRLVKCTDEKSLVKADSFVAILELINQNFSSLSIF
jgi:hypothetical protein